MPLHDDLLSLARHLVDRNPGAPVEADLRRAVSTAYYALFHLLVHESTMRLIAVAGMRSRVGRAFDHGVMKTVCKDYTSLTVNPAGQPVPQQIRDIASAFVELQEARHRADYNTAMTLTYTQTDTEVIRA